MEMHSSDLQQSLLPGAELSGSPSCPLHENTEAMLRWLLPQIAGMASVGLFPETQDFSLLTWLKLSQNCSVI